MRQRVKPDALWMPGSPPINKSAPARPLTQHDYYAFERAIARPVVLMDEFIQTLWKRRPLRARRLRRDVAWIMKQARKAGVSDPHLEVPPWLR